MPVVKRIMIENTIKKTLGESLIFLKGNLKEKNYKETHVI